MTSATAVPKVLSANEAACVTGVPLRSVHRIIDTGVLGSAASRREGARVLHSDGLVSLKLVHETAGIFTLDGRRKLVRDLLGRAEAESACVEDVSVDVREMKVAVERGLSRLARAREAIAVDDGVLSGTPCVKGTRTPAHDIAEMLDNGDRIEAIQAAWPGLTFSQIDAAACYARAYPRRGRPRTAPAWRSRVPAASGEAAFDARPGPR